MDVAVRPADRPGFPDVEYPEQEEADGVGEGVEGCRQQHQPLRGDLVDHDLRAGSRRRSPLAIVRSGPAANGEDDRGSGGEPGAPNPPRIAHAQGRAASDPQVPGMIGSKPTPNQVPSKHRRMPEGQAKAAANDRVRGAGARWRRPVRRCPRRGR